MPRLPVVNGREVLRALQRAGFVLDTVEGSHHILIHPQTRRRISVPVHAGRDLKAGTLRSIIRDADMTVEQFVELLP